MSLEQQKLSGFNPLQIGSTLQKCIRTSEAFIEKLGFNPLQIGSTLQKSE